MTKMTKKQVDECLESARTGDIEEVVATANVAGIPIEEGDVFAREHVIEALSAAAAVLGRKGGQATSEAKTEAARVNARRGGRPKKRAGRWPYAVQVQPRNGQRLNEVVGLEIVYRDWNNADRKRHPQAERQLWDGACLVVDLDTDNVYAVEKP